MVVMYCHIVFDIPCAATAVFIIICAFSENVAVMPIIIVQRNKQRFWSTSIRLLFDFQSSEIHLTFPQVIYYAKRTLTNIACGAL